MPKIFVLRHQLAEQQARLKSQAKGSSGDSPTSGASDEEKLEQGPSSSSGENCANSDSRSNVTSQNYIVQNVQQLNQCESSESKNNGDNKTKDEQNAPLELITRQRSTGKIEQTFRTSELSSSHCIFGTRLIYITKKLNSYF